MEARKGSFLAYFSPSTSFEGGSSLTKNGNKDHKIEQLKQLIPLRVDELLEYLKNIQNSISNVQTGEQLVSYKFLLGVLVEMKRVKEIFFLYKIYLFSFDFPIEFRNIYSRRGE